MVHPRQVARELTLRQFLDLCRVMDQRIGRFNSKFDVLSIAHRDGRLFVTVRDESGNPHLFDCGEERRTA